MSLLSPSELILNSDGSIYHLHLQPEHIAETIITVGDPDRVPLVSQYFDRIDYRIRKREFVTHTGWVGRRRVTVISTGIGPDNMDIVLNELDALVNVDLKTRQIKEEKKSLKFIRVGTTGGIQPEHPVGTLVSSSHSIGMDNLLFFYTDRASGEEQLLQNNFEEFFTGLPVPIYCGMADPELRQAISGNWVQGITVTFPGFYAPQGRSLRLNTRISQSLLDKLTQFTFKEFRIINFEMETSALFGLAKLLGHRAVSCSVILANRYDGSFSKDSAKEVDYLIRSVLERLAEEE